MFESFSGRKQNSERGGREVRGQANPLLAVPDMKSWSNLDEPLEFFESAYAEL